jgi:hypothetical protein
MYAQSRISSAVRRTLKWIDQYSYIGARSTDVTTAATNALFLFKTRAPIGVGAGLAYLSALLALIFKVGSYAEQRYRQNNLLERANPAILAQLRQEVSWKNDLWFYIVACLNFLILSIGPRANLTATYYEDDKVLNSSWLYFGCIVASLLSSLFLESQLYHYGENKTRRLERVVLDGRVAAAAQRQQVQPGQALAVAQALAAVHQAQEVGPNPAST